VIEQVHADIENNEDIIISIHADFTNQMVEYYETCDVLSYAFAEKVFVVQRAM